MSDVPHFELPAVTRPLRAVRVGQLEFIRTDKIDWKMLRDQKQHLLDVVGFLEENQEPWHVKALTGILNLIDYLQEVAVDDLGHDANEVFYHVSDD